MVRPSNRSRGHPSIRWLLRRLAAHISTSALVYQSDRNELYFLKRQTMNFLNTESQNGFISSEMHSTLYNLAMDLIEHRRSVDIRYVEGALEGLLQTMFPHDEL